MYLEFGSEKHFNHLLIYLVWLVLQPLGKPRKVFVLCVGLTHWCAATAGFLTAFPNKARTSKPASSPVRQSVGRLVLEALWLTGRRSRQLADRCRFSEQWKVAQLLVMSEPPFISLDSAERRGMGRGRRGERRWACGEPLGGSKMECREREGVSGGSLSNKAFYKRRHRLLCWGRVSRNSWAAQRG